MLPAPLMTSSFDEGILYIYIYIYMIYIYVLLFKHFKRESRWIKPDQDRSKGIKALIKGYQCDTLWVGVRGVGVGVGGFHNQIKADQDGPKGIKVDQRRST